MVAFLVVLACCLPDASGADRRRRYLGPTPAQRNQMIRQIQAEMDSARKVLDQARSKTKMTDDEIKSARQKLDEARSAISKAGDELKKAAENLRTIEAEILAKQGPDTELGKAKAKVDQARENLDRALHRLVKLPDHAGPPSEAEMASESASLTDADRAKLSADAAYQDAQKALDIAKRDYSQVKTALLEADPDWAAASTAVGEARHKEQDAKKDARTAAAASRRDVRSQQALEAEALAVIAQGEALLRRLGVRNGKAR